MNYHLFLILSSSLLSSCSESSDPSPPQTVVALAGGDVVLPCSIRITASDDFPTVEWSKQGLEPNVVFLYRDGCETHEMKNPAFRYRTSLIAKELKNGNISLRISNVRLSDAGTYRCMSLWKKGRGITEVHLVVGAVSEPKLSVLSAEGGSVILQCKASCWLPEPRVNFLDSHGNDIPADEPRRDEDTRGCFTVRRRVTLQDVTNRVTCRVHQPETNQTRDSEILLPVQTSCYITIAIISVGVTISLLLACGLAVFLCRRCGKSGDKQKSPVTLSGGAENHFNVTIELLKSEVDDLKSKLREKEDSIRQLQNSAAGRHDDQLLISFSSARNRPPKARNVDQDNGLPVHSSHRRHSSPALFVVLPSASSSSSSGSLEKMVGSISRSSSSACSRPGANGKLQRRHSLVSSGRFTLPNLTEESEMLIA